MKAQPMRGQSQKPSGEVGADGGVGCGLERSLPPEGTGVACWNGLLVTKGRFGTSLVCRLRRKRGQQRGGAEKGRGLLRDGTSVTVVGCA